MGNVIGHGRCPRCASRGADTRRDNLILYSDGGEHCFACSYHKGVQDIRKRIEMYEISSKITADEVCLPEDVIPIIPEPALNWFYSYGFTHGDVVCNKLLWSEVEQRLIFPILDKDLNIYAWQGRFFGEGDKPKWKSKGKLHTTTYIRGRRNNAPIILVEDILSCWKIAKIGFQCGCLFGCTPPKDIIIQYTEAATKVIWWLDHDKRKEAVKYVQDVRMLGTDSSAIFTLSDPKDLSVHQIKQHIGEIYV